MQKEQEEALAAQISEQLGRQLLERVLSGKASPSELRVALDYVKHHGVTDDANRPGSPVRSVEEAIQSGWLPKFETVDQEIT